MSKSTLNKFPVLRLFITFHKVFYDIYGKTSRFHYFCCWFSGKGASGRNSAVGIPLTSGLAKQAAFPARQYYPRTSKKRWQKSYPPGELSWAKYLNLPGALPRKQHSRRCPPILQRDFTGVDPSCAVWTCGLHVPKETWNFFRPFIAIFHHFCSFSLTFYSFLISYFPPIPSLAVVRHVVKNASRPKPVIFTGLRREAFHVCWIVTLLGRLCKRFLRRTQFNIWGAINKEKERLTIRSQPPNWMVVVRPRWLKKSITKQGSIKTPVSYQ